MQLPATLTHQDWYTTVELAALDLPGLSPKRNRVDDLARDGRWGERYAAGEPLWRKRSGRGGPTEYHYSQLPVEAVLELARRGLIAAPATPKTDLALVVTEAVPESLWSWFDAQSSKTKAEAQARYEAVQAVEAARRSGATATQAVALVASEKSIKTSTLWAWLKLVKGEKPGDWLPALAPRFKGGGVKADIDAGLWQIFKSDFLRPEAPCYSECYGRLKRDIADPRGMTLPHIKTFVRRLEAEVPKEVITAARKGIKHALLAVPAQQRSVFNMQAMEAINIDGHKLDVFVRFPARHGLAERIGRATLLAMQDIYSRKILGWRLGESESTELTILCFSDVFRNYGIPHAVVMDNGRAFASKAVSGGAKTRFRGKIRPDEPKGLLATLGIRMHWATPEHGQAKPIERSFRTLAGLISRHPLCAGAYTGNNPNAKPENYGNSAVDFADLEKLVALSIEVYNTMDGRRGGVANGRSYGEVFETSYRRQIEANQVARLAPEQLRMVCLTMTEVRAAKHTGHIDFGDNRYWCPQLNSVAGETVTIRFDPDNLHQPIHVWRNTGEFVASAPIREAAGFLDHQAAKDHARLVQDYRKTVRKAQTMEGLLSAKRLADMMRTEPEIDVIEDEITVVTPLLAAPVIKPAPSEPRRLSVIDRFTAVMEAQEQSPEQSWGIFTVFDGGRSACSDPEEEPERS